MMGEHIKHRGEHIKHRGEHIKHRGEHIKHRGEHTGSPLRNTKIINLMLGKSIELPVFNERLAA